MSKSSSVATEKSWKDVLRMARVNSNRMVTLLFTTCKMGSLNSDWDKIYYLGEITLWQTRQKRRIRSPPDIRNATSASIWFVFWQFFLSCTITAKLISFIIMCHAWDCATFFPCAEQLSANADHRFLYGIRCPDSSQKRIFPTDFSAPYFTDFNRNGDPKHPDRDTDPGFGFLSQNIFFRTELVSVCLYRLPVDAPVSADSGKPYDKKRYATVFYPDSYRILRQRHPDSFSRCGRSIYRIPSHFQFTLRKQLLEPGISGTCLLSGQFFQTRRKPGSKKADASDTSDRYHRQPGHRHASDELWSDRKAR